MSNLKLDELTDSEIQLYLDGQLKGARKSDLEKRIALEPIVRQRIVEYSKLDKQFKKKYETNLFLSKDKAKHNSFKKWQFATTFAMGLAVAVLVMNTSYFKNQPAFVNEAVLAHFKYSPEQHLASNVTTLSFDKDRAQNNTFTPPNLNEIGLKLVGIRHLSLQEGNSVQLMYHDKEGRRYTVIITQNPSKMEPNEPNFYNTQMAQVSYWGNKKYNFAITAVNEGLDVRAIQPLIASTF